MTQRDPTTTAPPTWRQALRSRRFLLRALGTAAAVVVVLTLFSQFLLWNELRGSGVRISDPILARFDAVDLSPLTFALIYGSILLFLATHIRRPAALLLALQAYTLLLVVRIVAMYLLPLEAPAGMIPLVDNLVEALGPAQRLSRDLFFSGHTSTLVLLALLARGSWIRAILTIAAIGVGLCVILQKVHYSIDVFMAPMASWFCYSIVRSFWPSEERA